MRLYIPNNAVSTLESFFKYSDIELVKTPEVYFKAQYVRFNFDAVLILDGTITYDYIIMNAKLAGIPVYGIDRYDKNTQAIILNKAGINIPDTWYSFYFNNYNDIISLMNNVNDNDKIIVKYSIGARGLGQMLLTKRELIDIFDSDDSVLNKLFEETNNNTYTGIDNTCYEPCSSTAAIEHKTHIQATSQLNKTDDESQLEKLKNVKINKHSVLLDALRYRRDFTIQRYIPNRGEWRILWFHEQEPIIIKRNIDSDAWQANACNNSAGSSVVTNMSSITGNGIDYDKIDRFCKSLNVPFLSLDIYCDDDTKTWGIFEFQMEFGWTNTYGIDSIELNNKLNNSIKSLIFKQNRSNFI